MSCAELLLELRNLGARVWLEDDRLRVAAPQGALTNEIRRELKDRRSELLDWLKVLHIEQLIKDKIDEKNVEYLPPYRKKALQFSMQESQNQAVPIYLLKYHFGLSKHFL